MYRTLALIAFVSTTLACAGSPTSPSASSSLPRPAVHSVGALSWDVCINGECDGFHLDITNDGPGCADTVSLRGTATLREGQAVAKTTNWELTLGDKSAGVLAPGKVMKAVGEFGTLTDIAHHAYTADVVVTAVAPIACR